MNALLLDWGLEALKPWVSALLAPASALLVLLLVGIGLLWRWPRAARAMLAVVAIALWACCTPRLGHWMLQTLLRPPQPLDAAAIAALAGQPDTAVLVLGAGRRTLGPEYLEPDLKPMTLERLRYGIWLARQTRLPLGYSGGIGHGTRPGVSEAAAARRVAERDFGLPLRWAEDRSRDTRENAKYSIALLHPEGVRRIVLVTHDFHQQRALAAFIAEAKAQQVAMAVVPAPMGMLPPSPPMALDWLPSASGLTLVTLALHEWIGWLAGA